MSEVIYAVRRADGEQMGEYTFVAVLDERDWTPAEMDAECVFDPVVYELVKMTVEVIGTRTLPVCRECDAPATHWGLCEIHAREDDPEAFSS